MVIQLYIDYVSQPSRAVLALCIIGKIPFEVKETRIAKMEQRSQEYLKVNPVGKVPALVDTENGLVLSESHAMMRYLCMKYPEHVQDWYPANDYVARAKIDQYLDFHHLNTRRCANLIFNTLFAPNLGIKDPSFSPELARKEVRRALKLLTKIYLPKTKFINRQTPSIADLSAVFEVEFLKLIGETFDEWPLIKEWIDRMNQIPAVIEANKAFRKVLAKRQKAKL